MAGLQFSAWRGSDFPRDIDQDCQIGESQHESQSLNHGDSCDMVAGPRGNAAPLTCYFLRVALIRIAMLTANCRTCKPRPM